MLSYFIYSINVVLPVFILAVFGYLLKRAGFLTESFLDVGEKLVFKAALPVMLFKEVAASSFSVSEDISFLLFCVVSVLS